MPEYTDDDTYGDTDDAAKEEATLDLTGGLPGYLARAEGTGNYNLLYPIGAAFRRAEHDIESVDFAQNVQDAETLDQLKKLGELLDAPPEEGEALEHYRARLLAEGAIVTSEGTPNDIIIAAAEIAGIDEDNIKFSEPSQGSSEWGTASVGIPLAAIDAAQLSNAEIDTFLDRVATVGCRIVTFKTGTFTYISPSTYNQGGHDASRGYDGLSGGNPKGNGGTYSGVI